MIRWNILWSIFSKEVLDTFRDRKTLAINVGLPIVLYPVLILVLANVVASDLSDDEMKDSDRNAAVVSAEEQKPKKDPYRVMLAGDAIPGLEEFVAGLRRAEVVTPKTPVTWDLSPLETFAEGDKLNADQETMTGDREDWPESLLPLRREAEELIRGGQVDVVLLAKRMPHDFDFSNYWLFVLEDIPSQRSRKGADYIHENLGDFQDQVREERFNAANIDSEFAIPIRRYGKIVTPRDRFFGFTAGSGIPMLLILMLILSAFYPAIDATAGEKEHGTLATVIGAPITPLELILGKFGNVVLMAMIGATANLASMASVYAIQLQGTDVNIPPTVPFTILLAFLPTAMFVAAACLCVASFANNFKEAQNMLTPFMFIAMMPGFVAMAPNMELTANLMFVPILNVTLLIKGLLLDAVSMEAVFLIFLANLAYSLAVLVLAAKIFAGEEILAGTDASFADVLTLDRDALPRPNTSFSIILFMVFLVIGFYVNHLLFPYGIKTLLFVLQIVFFTGGSLLTAWYYRFDFARTFALRPPTVATLGLSVLVGASLWLSQAWVMRLVPPPEEWLVEFTRFFTEANLEMSLLMSLTLFALLPAIGEELLFRGVIMRGLLNDLEAKWAILLQALFFGLMHMSIYRLLPTMLIGLVTGYVVWRTGSLLLGMVVHGLNNGLIMIVLRNAESVPGMDSPTALPPWYLVLAATFICGGALYGIHVLGREQAAIAEG